MNRNPDEIDLALDGALDAIRDEEPDPRIAREAAERVWARLQQEQTRESARERADRKIRDCADFQALIPAYLRDGLTEAKALLLRDHLTECVPCRRAYEQARRDRSRTASSGTRAAARGRWSTLGWRVAAVAAVLLAVAGLSFKTDMFTIQAGGIVHVESIDGKAFRVDENGTTPLKPGDSVDFRDGRRIRTGKDARLMLRMEDDSRVEVSQRAELSVYERRKLWQGAGDGVIDLDRGSVIVEASDQGSGHLYVDTPDAQVAVTGTVFAVNTGVKGSRVSVVEGEVHVDHGSEHDILHPGEQATTAPGLGRVAVEDEIAWSANFDRHLALLREFARLGEQIDRQVASPGVRYDTKLLDLVPAGTTVYAAIPNFSETLTQAYDLLRQRVSANDLLRDWWSESVVATGAEDEIETAMDRIRTWGDLVGDEIVVSVQNRVDGKASVVILAELPDAAAFHGALEDELADLAARGVDVSHLRVLDGHAPSDSEAADLYVMTLGGLLALSPQAEPLREVAATVSGHAPGGFADTPFHDRLAAEYRDGVTWMVGVDVHSLHGLEAGDANAVVLERLGILDLEHVIARHDERDGRSENRAVLAFDRTRRGLASWLAEPAPMGALEFVSPDPYLAAGFVMKEPALVVDEILDMIGSGDPEGVRAIEQFQRDYGIDLRHDVAEAIGGEFVLALDGPVLPTPSWKLVLEVYDPDRLEATLEWAVARLDEALREHGAAGLELASSTAGGRTYHVLRSLDTGIAAQWTFVDGYMLAAPSRTLIDRALEYRAAGISLEHSPAFTSLMPRDGRLHFSAVVFQNLGAILKPLADSGIPVSGRGRSLLDELGAASGPSLTLAYGDPNRISLVNTTEGGLLRQGLMSILSLDGLATVQEWLGHEAAAGPAAADDPS